jgi:hypothetical protein
LTLLVHPRAGVGSVSARSAASSGRDNPLASSAEVVPGLVEVEVAVPCPHRP